MNAPRRTAPVARRRLEALRAPALVLLLALAGCERPSFSEAPVTYTPTTSQALPAPPDWAVPMLGKGVRDVFPEVVACEGSADAVDLRYVGAPPGSRLTGWAWDVGRRTPPERIVLADAQFRIIGAGETGVPRPDVAKARPEVTSPLTGWRAHAGAVAGVVEVFAVDLGKGACRLGRLEL